MHGEAFLPAVCEQVFPQLSAYPLLLPLGADKKAADMPAALVDGKDPQQLSFVQGTEKLKRGDRAADIQESLEGLNPRSFVFVRFNMQKGLPDQFEGGWQLFVRQVSDLHSIRPH